MGVKELKNNLFSKSQKLLKEIEQNKDIFIFANSTVDGVYKWIHCFKVYL